MGRLHFWHKLTPGCRLLRPLRDSSGRVLLQAGTILTERYLELIEQWGLQDALLLAQRPSKARIYDHVTRTHIIDAVLQTIITNQLADIFDSITSEKALPIATLRDSAALLVQEIVAHRHVALDLSALRDLDENTFTHSLSVAVFAIATGVELDLQESALMEIAMGALLHDLGKIKVAPAILNKPSSLSAAEREIIQQHPRWGVELLQERGYQTSNVLLAIYEHHERCDGSGYPFGLYDTQISQIGKITAVADFYDALTSNRAYRSAVVPHLVVEELIANSLTLFNSDIVWAFVRSLALYPVGSIVLLDNGERGEVIGYDREMPNRPRVLVTHDATDRELEPPFEYDLTQQLNRFIVKVESAT